MVRLEGREEVENAPAALVGRKRRQATAFRGDLPGAAHTLLLLSFVFLFYYFLLYFSILFTLQSQGQYDSKYAALLVGGLIRVLQVASLTSGLFDLPRMLNSLKLLETVDVLTQPKHGNCVVRCSVLLSYQSKATMYWAYS